MVENSQMRDTRALYYFKVLRKVLVENGVKWHQNVDTYRFTKDDCSYVVRLSEGRIAVYNEKNNTAEHYVFNSKDENVILLHYGFVKNSLNELTARSSALVKEENNLYLKSEAALLNTTHQYSCANKIIFFSNNILKEDLNETLALLSRIDHFKVMAYELENFNYLENEEFYSQMLENENRLTNNLTNSKTR